MKNFLLVMMLNVLCCFYLTTSAQTPNCGTDESIENAKKNDISYKNYLENNLKERGLSTNINPDNSTIYTVPIIFIVYHLGEAVGTGTNVSDANIQAALAYMNTEWRASTPQFANGNDTKIQFAMAQRSPSCQPINGIVRVNASGVSGYASGGVPPGSAMEQTIRNLTPEYNQLQLGKYCIVRIVTGVSPYAGYAYYGGDVLFDYHEMNGNTNNILLAHEMGHVFFLPHTFQGSYYINSTYTYTCPINNNPSTDGDGIADTDPHKQSDFDCINTTNINSCTGLAYGSILKNFMSYASASCIDRFTAGQIYKMRYSLLNSMTGLLDPLSLAMPTAADNITASSCSITTGGASTSNYFTGISNFTFNGINNNSNSIPLYYGFYNNYSCFQRTTVTAGETYPVQISVSTGSNRRVYIDYDDNGVFNETNELVFNNTAGANGNITISNTSVKNKYLRMRVLSSPVNTSFSACNLPSDPTYGYGEIEDYGVQILNAPPPTIAFASPYLTGACVSSNTFIGFTTTGFFNAGNDFQVQLSDASGIFPTTPTVVSSGYINGSNIISVLFLANLTSSTSYKIRIVATNPSTVSPESSYISILNRPIITATETVICTGGSSTLSTPLIAGVSYQWVKNNVDIVGANSNTYPATSSGTYYVRATVSGCVQNSNSIVLYSYQTPTISYTGSTTICAGASLGLIANPNNQFGTNLPVTYQWKKDGSIISGETTPNYFATSLGIYSCTVTQGNCSSTTTSGVAVITKTGANSLDNFVSLTAGNATTENIYYQPYNLCSGSMKFSTSHRSFGTTYQWQLDGVDIAGETNATYSASQSGFYSVKITQNTCTGTSTPVALNVGSIPIPTLSPDANICTGSNINIFYYNQIGSTCCGTGIVYQWQKDYNDIVGANSSTYNASVSGNYMMRVTQGACVITSAPMKLVVGNNITSPIISNSIVSDFACSTSPVQLNTYTYGNLSSPVTYQWVKDGVDIPSTNSSSYSTNISGKYQVRATQGTCSAISNEVQEIFGELGSVSIFGNTKFCGSTTTTLSVSPTCSNFTYQWKRNGTNISGAMSSTYSTNVAGVYTVEITNGTKVVSSSSISIYEDCSVSTSTTSLSKPSIYNSNSTDKIVCSGYGKQMIYCDDYFSQYPTVTYQWYKDGTLISGQNRRFLVTGEAGNYQVQLVVGATQSALSNNFTLSNSGSFNSLSTPNGTVGCTEVMLTSPIPTYSTKSFYNYQWKKDGVNITGPFNYYRAMSSGNYSVEVSLGNCVFTSPSIPVIIGNTNPTISSSPSDKGLCPNGYVSLNSTLTNIFNYQWLKNGVVIPNINTSNYTATTAGNYSFIATQGACTYNSALPVAVTASSTSSISPSIGFVGGYYNSSNTSLSVCTGSNTTLNVNPQSGRYQYQWKNGSTAISGATSATYQPSVTGVYSADITTLGGCIFNSPSLSFTTGTSPTSGFSSSDVSGTTLCSGSNANLSVGYQIYNSYQWYKDDILIPNATGANYITNVAGSYRAEMMQGTCSQFSPYQIITTNATTLSPRLSVYTTNDVACNLTYSSLSVAFSPSATYQWQRNGLNVSGATNSYYNATQNGTYQVIINQGTCTGTSNPAEIQNGLGVSINPNGLSSTLCGEGGLLLASTGQTTSPTYQWKKDGVNLGSNVSYLPVSTAGNYTVTVTSNGCIATSQSFNVTSFPAMESTKTGTWNNPVIWTCLRTPNFSDNVKVNFGHVVSLPHTSTYFIKSINNVGNVSFGTGSNLRIGF